MNIHIPKAAMEAVQATQDRHKAELAAMQAQPEYKRYKRRTYKTWVVKHPFLDKWYQRTNPFGEWVWGEYNTAHRWKKADAIAIAQTVSGFAENAKV